ncbi:MAG: TIGR01459 family HAD-type hydrolase, partial [Pseudomonadota bacterium]
MTATPVTATPRILDRFEEISAGYDVLLCDLWGCYHNGVEPYPAAVAALQAFRRQGGAVVLLTNAPRPSGAVKLHLDAMGAPEDSYDAIVSSGDATRAELAAGRFGRRIHIVGADRDRPVWEGLDLAHAPLEEAESILCAGLRDDSVETPADYADLVAGGVARDLPFACANPDIVVDRAEARLWCAGAIARDYAAAGGRVFYFGKPHAPIYHLVLSKAETLRPG